jgi:hypothetical protein
MNIDELTLGQIKEISKLTGCSKGGVGSPERDFVVGENVLIRTVTHFWVGTVTRETDRFVTLHPAAWVADTGRFHDCLRDGTLSELEPACAPQRVAIGAIVDVAVWNHTVPTKQK